MKLKNSGIVLESDPRRYVNTQTGEVLMGITGIIKNLIFPDMYGNVPEHILQNAAERGSRIHAETQEYDLLGIAESDEAKWYALAMDASGFEVINTEYIVSDFKAFASPIDKVLVRDGKLYLADLKTTYKLDVEYLRWQLTFLEYLLKITNPDIEVAGLVAIWINRKAKICEIHEIEPIPADDFNRFLDAVKTGEYFESPYKQLVKTDDSEQALALIEKLAEVAEQIEFYKGIEKQYKAGIEQLFESASVDRWETDRFVITKTKGYERTTLDEKKLKAEHPEIFEQYSKKTAVRGSIKTQLK